MVLNNFTAANPGDSYLYSNGSNILIGTYTPGTVLKVFSGGYMASNVVATFNAANTASSSNTTGAVTVAGGLGVTGNVYSNSIYTNGLYSANGGTSLLSDSIVSTANTTAATSNAVYQAIQAAVASGLALSIALG